MSDSAVVHAVRDIPEHLAIIMDGNSRWAKRCGKSTPAGHRAGVETVRKVLRLCADHKIKIVTLFAFSSENWQRPSTEVNALMTLFSTYLKREIKKLSDDGVRVRFIGDRQRFSPALVRQMDYAEQLTANNSDTTLVIAVDYGGRWDITHAARQLAVRVQSGELQPEQINEQLLNSCLSTADLPEPDLCIRTAGEQRISNFLLWQLAYAELFFTDTLWPDFDEADMLAALASYQQRQRRFGGRAQTQVDNNQIAGSDPASSALGTQ
jgi:undecaprenyl diphosphate synthase